ncbi:MAG: SAM-dependent methyltransferase [Bacteroidota bacterium]
MMDNLNIFISSSRAAIAQSRFVKLTLSKLRSKGMTDQPKAIYFRPVEIKGELVLQLTYRYPTKDETHNFEPDRAWQLLEEKLGNSHLQADLFTLDEHLSLRISRKGKASLHRAKARHEQAVSTTHNRKKQYLIPADRPYLKALGVVGKDGQVLAKARDKYKQINKFAEVIDGLLADAKLSDQPKVVDMGAGSGYLTFALYDVLNQRINDGKNPEVLGVEIRPDLIKKGNDLARDTGFDGLKFVEGYIGGYELNEVDLLIALHACDTATDDALHQGIQSGAELIVVAPCCHKQVRRATDIPEGLSPLLRHGILLERQSEMLTDAIRALALEAAGYRTKVFEFIPLEHTAKNVMITAQKAKPRPEAMIEARQLMAQFGIARHHLLDLLAS